MAIITTTVVTTRRTKRTPVRRTTPIVELLKEEIEKADTVVPPALDEQGKNPLAEEESIKEISKGSG